jgi:hypothetical protein
MNALNNFDHLSKVAEPLSASLGASVLLSREKFALSVGIPIGVVIGWCDRGYIPTISIGKYSLINVALLQKQCLEKEFA